MKTASFIPSKHVKFRIFSTSNNIMALWLFILCGMVFLMIFVGGLTRLTHSGLSMVNWQPLSGWLPPLSLTEWESIFDLYRTTPEYKKVNFGMSLDEFKSIFWLEYIHRLWGRVIGIVFIFPFLFFLIKKWIGRKLLLHLVLIFTIGLFQGFLGWYMVKSGLVDRPDVSQYRLVAHLSVAIGIYCYMLWVGMWLMDKGLAGSPVFASKLFISSIIMTALIYLTIVSGGFVAGLDAGLTYNTFPLMDGNLVPDGLWNQSPWYKNLFENITTVQFNHRLFAKITFVFIILNWWASRKASVPYSIRRPINFMFVMVCLQFTLGVMTLVLVVPIFVASLHQLGALLLLTFSLWTVYRVTVPIKNRR